jgi:hypothetical protein
MAVWKEGRTHFFACDVCEHQIAIEEQQNASRDEMRIIPIRLKEDGWLLNKRPGRSWEAQCPECAQYSGYKMGPDALDL